MATIPTQEQSTVDSPVPPSSSRTALHRLPRAVAPQPVPDGADLDHPSLYFNRELGWLDFNWRVVYQAQDERLPLL